MSKYNIVGYCLLFIHFCVYLGHVQTSSYTADWQINKLFRQHQCYCITVMFEQERVDVCIVCFKIQFIVHIIYGELHRNITWLIIPSAFYVIKWTLLETLITKNTVDSVITRARATWIPITRLKFCNDFFILHDFRSTRSIINARIPCLF